MVKSKGSKKVASPSQGCLSGAGARPRLSRSAETCQDSSRMVRWLLAPDGGCAPPHLDLRVVAGGDVGHGPGRLLHDVHLGVLQQLGEHRHRLGEDVRGGKREGKERGMRAEGAPGRRGRSRSGCRYQSLCSQGSWGVGVARKGSTMRGTRKSGLEVTSGRGSSPRAPHCPGGPPGWGGGAGGARGA